MRAKVESTIISWRAKNLIVLVELKIKNEKFNERIDFQAIF